MTRTVTSLAPQFLDRVLRPYKPGCRYVLDATLEHSADRREPVPGDADSWIAIEGRCSVPASCYIDDTGHFNAVELNITYNQLLYCGLAATARDGLIAALPWDGESFFRHQLPDVLIVEYDARFPRPLSPRDFRGRFEIREVIPKRHHGMFLLRTACSVHCEAGGRASAEVLIALVNL